MDNKGMLYVRYLYIIYYRPTSHSIVEVLFIHDSYFIDSKRRNLIIGLNYLTYGHDSYYYYYIGNNNVLFY